MPFVFTCPHCETRTKIDDQYAGRTGRCVSCNRSITVPAIAGAPEAGLNIGGGLNTGGANRAIRWVVAVIVLGVLGLGIMLAVVRVGGTSMARLNANRQQNSAMAGVARIAAALNNYADDFGTYPPAAIYDRKGKPMHSWRVLLLPYLDEQELYDDYDFDLPWDDLQNLQLQYRMPSAYLHPANAQTGVFNSISSYYLVTGPGTLFPPEGPLSPKDVGDDAAQTLLVVEGTPNIASNTWTEPIDLAGPRVVGDLSRMGGGEPGGLSIGGFVAATVDGRGHFVPESLTPDVVQALITPDGGERLPDDTLD